MKDSPFKMEGKPSAYPTSSSLTSNLPSSGQEARKFWVPLSSSVSSRVYSKIRSAAFILSSTLANCLIAWMIAFLYCKEKANANPAKPESTPGVDTMNAATAKEKIDPIMAIRNPSQLLKTALCHADTANESVRLCILDINTSELENARIVLNPCREVLKCEIMGDFWMDVSLLKPRAPRR